jgi:pimeloyl-ACP methyl ester carboxylesterase
MPTPKPTRKHSKAPPSFEKTANDHHPPTGPFPNVSPRWLLGAAAIVIATALAFAWLTLCLLYWQGNWQLLYHPSPTITRTPASADLAYEPIHFAATETGVTQLTGWWLPSPNASHTVLYLHGADGNLSNTVDALTALHSQNLAVLAIDYRGYGQSQPSRPNEQQLRQDAEWALTWLTLTRNIPAKSIVVYGSNLGADLAAELAADHSELAGVILDEPSADPIAPIFNDPRSRFIPAHWLVNDHYDLLGPAARLQLPSLWLLPQTRPHEGAPDSWVDAYGSVGAKRSWNTPATDAYTRVPGHKAAAWLNQPSATDPHFGESLQRWLDNL